MRELDSGLTAPYVVEARRKAFEDFVRGKSNSGYPGSGRVDMALCNFGFSDYFGPVTYSVGMHHGCWIMPIIGQNDNVVVFPSKEEAMGYGKTLLPILSLFGYFHSKVYAEKVAPVMTFGNAYTGSLAPTDSYDERDLYVLRIKVRK